MTGRCLYLAAVALALSGEACAQARPTCPVVPKSLAAMKNCFRPLLVFSASGDDLRLKRQVALLDAAADDMMDRFVLFTPIVPDGRRVSTPADSPYTILSKEQMKAVREQFHIALGEFTVLLVDEDGSVKLRAAAPVNVDRLNALIDKTPQRKAEMQRPHAN
ncbi:MAG TPA: DUF4174 domain-containing protein [Acidobacteriaceae bacterium]|jgi:hypothetical protein|nr:DUF4174 domain-containing protein [Acidobacteriaceae bacterium]